jgi:hypothetical protein
MTDTFWQHRNTHYRAGQKKEMQGVDSLVSNFTAGHGAEWSGEHGAPPPVGVRPHLTPKSRKMLLKKAEF